MPQTSGPRVCAVFTVSGRVQGVFFRASTAQEARRLRLTGHAINLANGDVEVLACGDAAQVAELEGWLHHGPPMAKVSAVGRVERGYEPSDGFVTG